MVVKAKAASSISHILKPKIERSDVLFSDPIFSVTSHLYYNRQREKMLDLVELKGQKFGRVAGL